MIDTHCHLADPKFDDDLEEVINRAKKSGIEKIIVCAEFRNQFEKILEMAKKYPNFIRPAIGIHPVQQNNTSVNFDHFEDSEEYLTSHSDEIVAIGEVGLDFTPKYLKDENDKKIQREILLKQIELSKKLNLPLNVHSRSAGKPAITFLIENGCEKVQMHAFSGNSKNAKAGIEAGFYFSIPPSFSMTEEKKALIEAIPMAQLLLETDSPVLGPDKQARNEPANIKISAEFIATVKKIPVEEVIQKTTENARQLYQNL